MIDPGELRGVLRGHVPTTPEEASHRERMLALLDGAGDPRSRAHFTPGHFTASAFVLDPAGSSLLLIHHRKLGRWLQPGGHLEPHDLSLEAAARREVAEEVGLVDLHLHPARPLLLDVDVHRIPALGTEPSHEHFDLRLLFVAPSREHHAGDEVVGARWFTLEALIDGASDGSVARAAARLSRAPH